MTFSQIYFYRCHYYNFCIFDKLWRMWYNDTEDKEEKGKLKMGRSCTVRMSNKNHSITNKQKLSNAYNHDLRKYEKNSENYDRNKIVLLIDKVRSANEYERYFNNLFREEVDKYNENQKRKDRRISNYFDHCCNKLGDVAVEMIFQACDKEFWEENKDKKEIMTQVYREQLDYFQNIMPDVHVVTAVVHQDETSPHLHLIAIPVASYEKGLKKRCSKTKVFTDKLEMIQDKMRAKSEELMRKYVDSSFKHDAKELGRNYDFTTVKYTEFAKKAEQRYYEENKDQIAKDVKDKILSEVEVSEEEINDAKQNKLNNELENYKIDDELVRTMYLNKKFDEFDNDDALQEEIIDKYEDNFKNNITNTIDTMNNLRNQVINYLRNYDLDQEYLKKISDYFFKDNKNLIKSYINMKINRVKFEDIINTVCKKINLNININIKKERSDNNEVKNNTRIQI